MFFLLKLIELYFTPVLSHLSDNEKLLFCAINKEVKAENKLRFFLINYDNLK